MPRLKTKYYKEIVPSLAKKLNYKNIMQVPKISKICINRGVGITNNDLKLINASIEEFTMITGQKAVVTKSKKDISNFGLRANTPIGVKVTLRNDIMYEFLDKIINIILPRVRDFKGLSNKAFDGNGNYTFGIKEQIVFPEISIDSIKKMMGMDITFVSNSYNDKEMYNLMKEFNFPFKN
ncbi:MAG: 50S ribosomal protein L5 [Bacteroides sp.]|nr:MAG: 50S ribosomal protein L5 [Bacteroides sp.]